MPLSADQPMQFSIREIVQLRDGEFTQDILSMALEPEIIIEEQEDYVAIKGDLFLSGEYRPSEQQKFDEDEMDHFLDHVTEVEDATRTDIGTGLIEHRFPVDITVPRERIVDSEEIFVTVEAFDYYVTENQCLQIEADISVSGIENNRPAIANQPEPLTIQDSDENYTGDPYELFGQPFYAEAFKEPELEDRVEETPHIGIQDRPETEPENEYIDTVDEMDRDEEDTIWDDDNDDVAPGNEGRTEYLENDQEGENSASSAPLKDENALYLTKMLSDEEENFSKMRMCIVQSGDSLEGISSRYNITVSSILRRNQMESGELTEGQVLYIPVSTK